MRLIISALLLSSSLVLPAQGVQSHANSLDDLVADGAEPRLLAGGFRFTEGPAADHRGNIYFSDIGSSRIHYWETATGVLTTVRENSDGADGLFVDRDGALLIT